MEQEVFPERVEAHLHKVLASKIFENSPQMVRLLRHIVEQTLRGNPGALKEVSIGLDVFGRGKTYDPRLDPVVRVEARRLRAKLADYYLTEGSRDETVISIPKGGYVAQFGRGSLVTFAAAPAVESPAEFPAPGVLAPPEPEILAPAAPFWRRPKFLLALLCIAAAGGALLALRSSRESTVSIAVLPFANLNADRANQFFNDGLTEEITDELSRFAGVRVVARSSIRALEKEQKDKRDLRAIGHLLHVSDVLEGSVEVYGDRFRVSAELERASDGSCLWSSTYVGQVSDLPALQSEVAQGLVASLKDSIKPAVVAAHVVRDEQAHEDYLKGRYEEQFMSLDSLERAAGDYRQAVARDPDYGLAYDRLGSVLYNLRTANFQTAGREQIEQLWRKAIQVDPALASPHEGLALLAMQYDWDWPGAKRQLEAVLARAPSPSAQMDEAFLALIHHSFGEADEHVIRAQDLDPLGPATQYNTGMIRLLEGRFAKASEQFETLSSRNPGFVAAAMMKNAVFVYEGHPERALPGLESLEKQMPAIRVVEAIAQARLGRRDEALRLLRPFEQNYRTGGVPLYWFALAHQSLGDSAAAVTWLNRSADARESQAFYITVDPAFASMRNLASFQALERRMHLD